MEAHVLISGAGHTTVRLAIEGMTCGGCAAKVQRTVAALPGVASATVDLTEFGRATVAYDPSQASLESITQAIAALDYGVHVMS